MENFLLLDYQLFELFNQYLSNSFFDQIMPFWRNKYFWAPVYLFVIIYMATSGYRKWWLILLILLLTMGLSDIMSSHLIKPYFGRLRPCNTALWAEQIHLLVPCGGGYSFTSSHATNHFTLATLLSFVFAQKRSWVLPVSMFWAFSISYGQVYVGVHYPMDILFGALLGLSIGSLGGTFIRKFTQPSLVA